MQQEERDDLIREIIACRIVQEIMGDDVKDYILSHITVYEALEILYEGKKGKNDFEPMVNGFMKMLNDKIKEALTLDSDEYAKLRRKLKKHLVDPLVKEGWDKAGKIVDAIVAEGYRTGTTPVGFGMGVSIDGIFVGMPDDDDDEDDDEEDSTDGSDD